MKKSVLIGIIVAAVVIAGVVGGVVLGTPNNNNGATTTTTGESCKHDDPTQIVVVEAVPATCQETGLTEGMKCTLCGTMVVPQAIVEAECLIYKLNDDGTYCVDRQSGKCICVDLVIPATYKSVPVTTIDEGAFYGSTSMVSITIPKSILSIGKDAFGELSNRDRYALQKVYYEGDISEWLRMAFENVSANPLSLNTELYCNNELISNLVIPDSVTTIGDVAFFGCSSIKSVVIGDSVTSIGTAAFQNCASIETIEISNSVTEIEKWAFCVCKSLKSIDLPNSITEIGDSLFAECQSLQRINFEGTTSQWGAVEKLSNWDYGTGEYTVYCTNGEIAKDGTITYK